MRGPAAPRFTLSVGVTGHRIDALPEDRQPAIAKRAAAALALLQQEALAIFQRAAELYAPDTPRFTLVSPLASGADQIAASVALERGWTLQAVLPMSAEACAAIEPGNAAELHRLIAASQCVLELPGGSDDLTEAFVHAGRATVAHCDLLLAIWDGLPARGRGGTAETIDLALLRGTPVLHIPVDPDQPSALLWSAFDPVVITGPGDLNCRKPATAETIRQVLQSLIAPPLAETERRFANDFLAETDRLRRWRIEYPLLLAVTGIRALSPDDLSARRLHQANRSEWEDYRLACAGCHGVDASIDALEDAYGWSDRLATHFAQVYRSSHVLNFLLAALGAWIGLSGLVLDASPLALALAEFAVVLIVVVNTITGARRCWQRRWLDYRQLAERLRPMRSMKLLGIAAPDPPGDPAEPVSRRWIDWYAAAVWRSIGCPAGRMRSAALQTLAAKIAERELQPQVDYNFRNAAQAERLDRRLEAVGLGLFVATLLLTMSTVVALELWPALIARLGNWTTVFSAGLPALGTAIFGIRVQGDFGAAAARSRNTGVRLDRIARELRQTSDLSRASDLVEQGVRVMLSDLGEWRLVTQLHELSLG